MSASVHPLSRRESYRPVMFTRFLWWLSAADEALLIDCTVDRGRYAITGFTVLATWLFATLAWSYFFFTVVHQLAPALLLGIFMGGIILTIDRALIKGINPDNKKRLLPLLFRGLLALTIGTFMAQPALLYLFDKEIHVQISIDNEQKLKDKQHMLDTFYAAQEHQLQQQKTEINQQLAGKYNEVAAARNNFISEADGTGGSGKPGLKTIAAAKQNEYLKLLADYTALNTALQPQLAATDSALASIEQTKKEQFKAYTGLMNDGFLTRSEALQHLIQTNSAAQFRYYLLVLILVLIELMPVIAKTLLPDGSYDEKQRLREAYEKKMAAGNQQHEEALAALYGRLAFESDSQLIQEFFEEAKTGRHEKYRQKFSEWQEKDAMNFDAVWQYLKKDLLSKQEN